MRLRHASLLLLVLVAAGRSTPASAQETSARREIRESQQRLEQIRREREQLQQEMTQLQSRARDAAAELRNIQRQRAISERALQEIEFQTATLSASIDSISGELFEAREQLRQRTHLLGQRLRVIYKRGPMHAARVVLSARSFGDLLTRYKYLYQIALHDRALQRGVAQIETELEAKEAELQMQYAQLESIREERLDELEQLRRLGARQAGTVRGFEQQEKRTQDRIQQLARDEARLSSTIAELERKRIDEAGAGRAAASTLTTRDHGNLPWPVDGEILYRFGIERRPNGVVLRNNGLGISAPAGTAVRAVESGRVDLARGFEGYGPTVILSHGGGYYTLYHHLGSIAVREGQSIPAGHVLGTVGGERTPEGPHIEFRVQAPVGGSMPEPVDPVPWLRARSGR